MVKTHLFLQPTCSFSFLFCDVKSTTESNRDSSSIPTKPPNSRRDEPAAPLRTTSLPAAKRSTMRRLLFRQLERPSSNKARPIRSFSYNAPVLSSRPQLPFLSIPTRFQRQQWRYLTTERKEWLKRELKLTVKWTSTIYAIVFFSVCIGFAVQQEFFERLYPTPHEWSFFTRLLKRGTEAELGRTDTYLDNWALIVQMSKNLLERLEDPNGDGAGLRDLGPGYPEGAKDLTEMPEAWRRGYFQALLLYSQAAEKVEGWVLDKKRKMVFPADVVKGPSNPFPKPVPIGASSAPLEEDCEPAGYPNPDKLYQKLLATVGLTSQQRMTASLAYANWLEYKGFIEPAAMVYDDALNMAIEEISTPGAPPPLDPKTGALNEKTDRKPSANLLASLTAVATFRARHDDVATALPILISILQARRALPSPASARHSNDLDAIEPPKSVFEKMLGYLKEPPYPPPPPDGTETPLRDSKELCEEAALHLHIGEIMYAKQKSGRETGIGWTREGVDLAEEELHKVLEIQQGADRDAKKKCRECLGAGLGVWATMVERLVKEEEAAKAAGKGSSASGGWFGFWSGSNVLEGENGGRWAAEEKVVEERTRRAAEILEDLQKPPSFIWSGLVMT